MRRNLSYPSFPQSPYNNNIIHPSIHPSITLQLNSKAVSSRQKMASSMISSTHHHAISSPTVHHNNNNQVKKPSSVCFQGLRPLTARRTPVMRRNVVAVPARSRGGVRAELSPSLVISLSTGLSLFLGRFVFFNFQRENVAKQGLPEQNGITHFEAGDSRAKEYVSILKSNDPVGFNLVDVLAWGSLGHIVAYYILATSSNGYDPSFFPK